MSKKFHLKVENATNWKTIFAYESRIQTQSFKKKFGGEILDDFIKITCCQKLQKVDIGCAASGNSQKTKPSTVAFLPFSRNERLTFVSTTSNTTNFFKIGNNQSK